MPILAAIAAEAEKIRAELADAATRLANLKTNHRTTVKAHVSLGETMRAEFRELWGERL